MSYDFDIKVPTGRGDEFVTIAEWNCTSNVSPMWTKALAAVGFEDGLGDLIEQRGRADAQGVVVLCARASSYMLTHRADFEAMNPPNGWGNAEGAYEVLAWLAGQLDGRTAAIVTVHR